MDLQVLRVSPLDPAERSRVIVQIYIFPPNLRMICVQNSDITLAAIIVHLTTWNCLIMGYSQFQWIRIILFLINHDHLVARFANKSISIPMAAKKLARSVDNFDPKLGTQSTLGSINGMVWAPLNWCQPCVTRPVCLQIITRTPTVQRRWIRGWLASSSAWRKSPVQGKCWGTLL